MRVIFGLLIGGLVFVGAVFAAKPLLKWRARTQRGEFCRALIAGDKRAALSTIPNDTIGRDAVEQFMDLRWPVTECVDAGAPGLYNSPSPFECPMRRQDIRIETKMPIRPKNGEILEAHLGFVYNCFLLFDYTGTHLVGGALYHIQDGQTGRVIMNMEPLGTPHPQ